MSDKMEPGTVDDDGRFFRCECCAQLHDGGVVCEACCTFVDRLLTRTTKAGDMHPTQPTVTDAHGVVRFKRNDIVRWLLDAGPFDMNTIAVTAFDAEDRRQFAQLIGYSVSGYQDLNYATPIEVAS